MSTARTPEEAAQISKDRKALLRGALITGAGLAGGIALLRKAQGGVKGGTAWVPPPPKPKPLRKGEQLQANALRKGKTAQGAMERQIEAGDLRAKRAYGAMRPVSGKKLAKLSPENRKKYGELVTTAETARGRMPKNAAGQISPKEAFLADREARRRARVEVAKFRRTKGFGAVLLAVRELAERRDRADTLRDTAVAAGALASGGAAVYGAREWARTNRAAQGAVKEIVPMMDPKAIVREGVTQIGSKAKRKAKEYFPTFIKGGKAVGRVLKKKVFATPADGLIEFGGRDQWKEAGTNVYADPLKGAAGLQHVYYKKDASGNPDVEDLPLAHAQTVRAALRRGEKINRVATRGGRLGKDVVDTVRGKPRGKDAAGRTKKREWEKSWFREGVKKAAAGAAVLGYYGALRKSPKLRSKHQRAVKWASDKANQVVPDIVPRSSFATPADGLVDFARKPVDPKEEKKILRAARIRNGLVGAAAGSFLGAGLYGGKSGYDGARIGAALGGLYGAGSNPKRRAAIEQLQVAAFATPAEGLVEFEDGKRFKKVVKNPETGRTRTVKYGQAGKAADGGDRIRPGTAKGDAYCARSAKIAGDWKSDPNSPNNLSRKKWKCRGDKSMRSDFATPADGLVEFAKPYRSISVKRYPGQPLRPGAARGQFYKHVMGYTKPVPARGGEGVKEAAAAVRVYKGNPVGKEIESVRKRIAKDPRLAEAAKFKDTPALVEKSAKYGDTESYKKGSRAVKGRIDEYNRLRAQGKSVSVAAGMIGSPLVEVEFATAADRLIGFDAVANEAGWDIRDPRGKSARVFAPGSRRRNRREKEWHEKVDNERTLWKAGMVAAALAAGAGGAAVGRRFPRKPAAAIDPATQKVVRGPWKKSG